MHSFGKTEFIRRVESQFGKFLGILLMKWTKLEHNRNEGY